MMRLAQPAHSWALSEVLSLYQRDHAYVAALVTPAIRDEHCPTLSRAMSMYARRPGSCLALDLSLVRDFPCAWINVMLAISRQSASVGGRFVVFGLAGECREVLATTNLDRWMCIVADESRAMEYLGLRSESWSDAVARRLDVQPAAYRHAA
ncbi:MAG: hypothetical protein SFZ23_05290 [Planctomycetota bacterium]|nr:hypothetical protein [Planctomycetota bacterium]